FRDLRNLHSFPTRRSSDLYFLVKSIFPTAFISSKFLQIRFGKPASALMLNSPSLLINVVSLTSLSSLLVKVGEIFHSVIKLPFLWVCFPPNKAFVTER